MAQKKSRGFSVFFKFLFICLYIVEFKKNLDILVLNKFRFGGMKLENRRGLTVTEIMIAAVIVCVLASVFIPLFMSLRARERTSDCAASRSALTRAMLVYQMTDSSYSLDELFSGKCPEFDRSAYQCPSGGEYSYISGRVVCSEHEVDASWAYFKDTDPPSIVRDLYLTVPGVFKDILGDGMKIPTDFDGSIADAKILRSDGTGESLFNMIFKKYHVFKNTVIIPQSIMIYTRKVGPLAATPEEAEISCIVYENNGRMYVTYANYDVYSLELEWGKNNISRFVRSEEFLLRYMLNNPDSEAVCAE